MADLVKLEIGAYIWDAIRQSPDFPDQQKRLAKAMSISPQYLNDLVSQRRPWTYDLLLRLPGDLHDRAMRALARELRNLSNSILSQTKPPQALP